MGFEMPAMASVKGNMAEENQQKLWDLLREFGNIVYQKLTQLQWPVHESPFFRPFSLVIVQDDLQVLVGCSPAVSIPELHWIEEPGKRFGSEALVNSVKKQLGRTLSAVVSLPLPDVPNRSMLLELAADKHIKEVESERIFRKLGDIDHVRHLEPQLRIFLTDHPDPSGNVFLMMRFSDTRQMDEIHSSVASALAELGMKAVRADDRDYTGELWSNIEVYLTGCQYGIAVFEDVDQRDFNPNVSLELGYMMGRGKRTLLLKERRLPQLPTDVVHRLYKVFDIFDIENSIKREVNRWVKVDLGL